MIKEFIFPTSVFMDTYYRHCAERARTDKEVCNMVKKYLESTNNINVISVYYPFYDNSNFFRVKIDISDSPVALMKKIKVMGLIPVEKSPYENQSDFDYTAEKYHKEIVKDLV